MRNSNKKLVSKSKKPSLELLKVTPKQAFFTVVSNNYLHFAITLLQSVKQAQPDSDLFCVIVDTDISEAGNYSNIFKSISLAELSLPEGTHFLFQYTVLELNTAVKPWAIEYLLDKGYENVFYIDPDIYVYRSLKEVNDLLSSGSDIVITPHLLSPVTDEKIPSELDIRRSGTYNFGFCAVRKTKNTYNFLRWWQRKLERECVVDLDKGIFVDQSWIDLVPGLFENVSILRHPGYNVAYWNIAQRKVELVSDGNWAVNGQYLVFFHYSGFNPLKPEPFSKHQNRYTLSSLGPAAMLAKAYAALLVANGAAEHSKVKYGYGVFTDGTPIPDIFRSEYRTDELLRNEMGVDPFSCSEALCFLAPQKSDVNLALTYSLKSVWNARRDLHSIFNLSNQQDVLSFYRWFLHDGIHYFSQTVLDQHLIILNKFLASQSDGGTVEVVQYRWNNYSDKSAMRVYSLFEQLLNRSPESSAIEHFAPMCETIRGTVLAWRDISMSVESRQKPLLIFRMIKALSLNKNRLLSTESLVPTLVKPANLNSTKPAKAVAAYSGFYSIDSDSEQNGVWVSDSVTLPFNAKAGDVVNLTGIYLSEFIEKYSGDGSASLRFTVGDHVVGVFDLQLSGEFTCSFELPSFINDTHQTINIKCSKIFVPKDIGLNDDDRSLAWRMKYLAFGSVVLVDVKRPLIFLAPEEYTAPPGINLIGYISAESGVGEAARLFAKAANASCIPYSIIDVGYQNLNLQRDKSAFIASIDKKFDIDIVYVNADQTPRTLDHLKSINHKSRIAIGFWHWEQPKLPNGFLNSFDGLTEVWTPSSFVQDAVAKIAPIPVFKVPHAIDFTLTSGVTRQNFGLPENCFLALVVYDLHSYQYRKNPEAAITAFRMAAANRDNVFLVIKTINADKHIEEYALLKKSVSDINNIIFIDGFLSRQEVYDLENCCDTLISLHRAEGFGLALAEMMYLGKPVIATGWSANMEFMTPMNSLPVYYKLKQLEKSVGVYEAGQYWAEADIVHAAECLDLLIDNPVRASLIGECAAISIREQLSPQVIGRHYRSRLSLIARSNPLLQN